MMHPVDPQIQKSSQYNIKNQYNNVNNINNINEQNQEHEKNELPKSSFS